MQGVTFSIHHGRALQPSTPTQQEAAGQPCCVVAHVPPSSGLVHVSWHSHSGEGGSSGDEGGAGSEAGKRGGGGSGGEGGGDGGDGGGGKQYIHLSWVVGSSS